MTCSFKVRKNLSATPPAWGCSRKAKLAATPRHGSASENGSRGTGCRGRCAGRARLHRPEPGKDPLGRRLEGGEAVPALGDLPPHALRVPVLHAGECPSPAVVKREHAGAVSPPHEVGLRGHDPSRVLAGGLLGHAAGGEEVRLPYQAQHPLSGYRDAPAVPQARPYLAVPLADKG